jgi:TPR repeat protein
MARLGYMYSFGCGVAADKAAARLWYSRAAAAGDDNGQHCFAAVLSEAGEHEEAERWLRKAAEQGYEPSINSLREQTTQRMLKKEHFHQALPLLKYAANAGSAWAHEWLGYMHARGKGVRKDREQAILHYEGAHEGGRRSAAFNAGRGHFSLGRPEAAIDWLRKDSYYPISSLYWRYRVLKEHPRLEQYPGEGLELLRKAADAGHVFAKRDIAGRMIKGQKEFGTRLQGLRLWLHTIRHGYRVIMDDVDDERLY